MPPGYDPHVVAASLVALLAALPEPLLTFSRYDAFLAAGTLDSAEGVAGASAANLRNLVMALPYSHKAVLVKLGRLLHAAWRWEHLPQPESETFPPPAMNRMEVLRYQVEIGAGGTF